MLIVRYYHMFNNVVHECVIRLNIDEISKQLTLKKSIIIHSKYFYNLYRRF